MKSKFILIIAAVMLIVALLAFAVPAMSPDVDVGVSGEGILAETADLAVMDSGAVLLVEQITPAPAGTAGHMFLWLALGATLLTVTIASRRGLIQKFLHSRIMSLRTTSDSTSEGAEMAGGPNRCITPAAA